MKIGVNDKNKIELTEVFNTIQLTSTKKEKLYLCMRDGGFEIEYGDKKYSLVDGKIEDLAKLAEKNSFIRSYEENQIDPTIDFLKPFFTNNDFHETEYESINKIKAFLKECDNNKLTRDPTYLSNLYDVSIQAIDLSIKSAELDYPFLKNKAMIHLVSNKSFTIDELKTKNEFGNKPYIDRLAELFNTDGFFTTIESETIDLISYDGEKITKNYFLLKITL